jgi:LPXTG-motif cell wall-anchored protein
MRKPLALLAALAAVLLVAAPSAAQAAYPPAPPPTVSNPTPLVGTAVSIEACCFVPGSVVTFSLDFGASLASGIGGGGGFRGAAAFVPTEVCGDSCQLTADSSGGVEAEVTPDEPGTYTATFTGTGIDGQPLTRTVTFEAQAAADEDGTEEISNPDGGGVLPDTGAEIATWTLTGAGLIALGALVVVGSRRRSHAES